jgi:hypothetical protein
MLLNLPFLKLRHQADHAAGFFAKLATPLYLYQVDAYKSPLPKNSAAEPYSSVKSSGSTDIQSLWLSPLNSYSCNLHPDEQSSTAGQLTDADFALLTTIPAVY